MFKFSFIHANTVLSYCKNWLQDRHTIISSPVIVFRNTKMILLVPTFYILSHRNTSAFFTHMCIRFLSSCWHKNKIFWYKNNCKIFCNVFHIYLRLNSFCVSHVNIKLVGWFCDIRSFFTHIKFFWTILRRIFVSSRQKIKSSQKYMILSWQDKKFF